MNWNKVPEDFYTNVGKSGLKISKVIVGCMSIGSQKWGKWIIEDEEAAFAILKKAYDEGIRTYDTADMYSNGESEKLLGKFIKKYNINRSKIVILTKCFFITDEENLEYSATSSHLFSGHEYVNRIGLSRKHIMDAVKGSVGRLGTYIDLLQIHRFDARTPIEETMKALHDVVESGDVRYIGASSMTTYRFVMMQHIAEKHNWTKFISMQNYYNLLYREEEREMIPYCKETGIGLLPWSPIATGVLARPLLVNEVADTTRASNTGFAQQLGLIDLSLKDQEIVKRVEELSKKHGVTMAAVATAWCLAKGACPIIGFSKPERIDDAIVGLKLKLGKEDVKYLDEQYDPHYLPGLTA